MAQKISNLALGSKIRDEKGNIYVVIAKDHYVANSVVLLHNNYNMAMGMSNIGSQTVDFSTSDVLNHLNNAYLNSIPKEIKNEIMTVTIPVWNVFFNKNMSAKAFILSSKEAGQNASSSAEKVMPYVANNLVSLFGSTTYWSRSKYEDGTNGREALFWYINSSKYNFDYISKTYAVAPVFNLPSSVMVSDNPSGSYYSFGFDKPLTIGTISNVSVNYGTPATITYVATDDITTNLTHYISFNNGSSWEKITPVKNGTEYIYSYDAGLIGTYSCRIKVVDGVGNEATSNLFTITVKASAPTVNIISVVDRVVTFKTNCLTHEISKVEILVNDSLVKTYSSGFNSSLSYEVDRSILNIGRNTMKIKATSSDNLEGYRDIEINKELYNLPPIGTKVIIGYDTYTIGIASQEGSNQVYTLDKSLLNNVCKGQEIKITQDTVKVLCSLSNLENHKDFKEMKLIKTKKLKGRFEGYVEEKYELEGEGRYSAIKLETERFNTNVESEIIELQQYFDYMED